MGVDEEVFEAISHPLRIRILELLAERPMSFAELKRALGVRSSGHLDFHLRKLRGLVVVDEEGRYTLSGEGYAALQAVAVIRRYGWQRRAYILNLVVYAAVNIAAAFRLQPWQWLTLFTLTTAWLAYYSYWSIVKRGVFRRC